MFSKALLGLMSLGLCAAHIEMSWPYPFRSKFDPETDPGLIDYSMTSPLNADGSNFPCKGYHANTPFRAVTEYQAGETYNVTLAGTATHGGGSCQLSLSYDNGASFHVIKSIIGGCPLKSTYDFQVPNDVADGDAIFAWSWFNLVGNREMYMNCAAVTITGGSGTPESFAAAHPPIFVANVGNGCSTVEQAETVFPNPGDQVEYGGSVSPDAPPFPQC
ncbi:hypothetical protein VTN49DRAFT_6304 [Thermomyces lanuginosus]|uniref:uncharacterized protein n=1 Tax=Thermomyces lanuginosus TaxID=5541 RepID=UPI003744343B